MNNEIVFEASDITKRYRKATVLNDVSLKLERGEIYGFIGENGAGKTTFMRLIAGLSYPSSGKLSLFGSTGERDLRRQRSRIGCMIESPALYGSMTARQNLEMQRIQRGVADKGCVDEALETVGLTDSGKKKARHFSLGMRQRLGIALALIGNPEFLILDEPVNGLDPSGVVEIRTLLRELNRERHVTLFLSSHILGELYQTATHYIILHKGRVLDEISQEDLDVRCRKCIAIRTGDPVSAFSVIEEALGPVNMRINEDGTILVFDNLDISSHIAAVLSESDITLMELSQRGEDLEAYFLRRLEEG